MDIHISVFFDYNTSLAYGYDYRTYTEGVLFFNE